MATNVTFNGVTYSVPAEGDTGWGPDLSAYFISIASNAFQKTGGSFTLTAEANFGATYGLKSVYYKSAAANPASAGALRLGNTQGVYWRNNANNADIGLVVTAGDTLQFNSANVIIAGLGSIVNADVNAAAAIAYSKLNLSSSIVNADVSNSAAIAYSKLNLATSIVNADIAAGAAIAYSKLAALTASRLLISDGFGVVSASSVTSTEAGYLSGVTSAIQTQLNAKAADNAVVHLSGAETVTGQKTFQDSIFTTNPLNLSIGQIKFPATQNASADANTLDDYEEGTWTPTVTSVTGSLTTVGTLNCKYLKIGKTVFYDVSITITTNGTGGGGIQFTLPFTSVDVGCGAGREQLVAGFGLVTDIAAGTTGIIYKYDGTYPGGNGYRLNISGQFNTSN